MVNYGRPSKDCLPCRRRKLRCDLDPSGCSQCRRAKLACHGYRNLNDLAFRDETQSVTQKALIRHHSVIPTAVPQSDWNITSRDIFLSLYIDRYSRDFDTLAPLLASSSAASYLHASVDAVSLAFMAYQVNRPDLTVLANRRYLAAIRSMRTAILLPQPSLNGDKMQFISNEFIQSVLLLDLYEKIDRHRHNTPPNVSSSWLSHASGALNMVRARPQTEFSDHITQRLASRTVFALIISCGAAGLRIPEALVALRNDLACHVRTPKWTFMVLLSAIVDLHADIRDATLSLDAILLRAQELNKQLALAENNIPGSWRPQQVYSESSMTFGRHYALYPDHYATQVFNAFRIMRLDMNAIIQNLSLHSSAREEIVEITQDICASVPQFLLQGAKSGNTLPLSPLQKLQCYGVLTPLFVAGQNTENAHMREWILQSLAFMTDNGVTMANDVRHILLSAPETSYWAVFAMLGSCGITA